MLLGANLWALVTLPGRLAVEKPAATADRLQEPPTKGTQPPPEGDKDRAREKFALALYRLAGEGEKQSERQWIERYRRLSKGDADLRVDDPKGQALVGMVSELARYSPEKIAKIIQESLGDQELVKMIGERVKARLAGSPAPP